MRREKTLKDLVIGGVRQGAVITHIGIAPNLPGKEDIRLSLLFTHDVLSAHIGQMQRIQHTKERKEFYSWGVYIT